jgi:1-acyl-sn-glycerol-3-phosphate acyltransferase
MKITAEDIVAGALCGFASLITGVRAVWRGSEPAARQRIYFANHRSHADFVLIWSSLPPALRRQVRPVAAADYWLASPLRRYLINRVFRGVLVQRGVHGFHDGDKPLAPLDAALDRGDSLIVFPEGTRNAEDSLLPFKSGIYRLAAAHPEVELIPVWIENLGRVMPKGCVVPIPLLCSLTFGPPLRVADGEARGAFLSRSRDALLALRPAED